MTQEQDFRKDFPSLEGKNCRKGEAACNLIFGKMYHSDVIENCCVDKQRLREAIEELKFRDERATVKWNVAVEELEKRMGL